jgi:hypothetical protein
LPVIVSLVRVHASAGFAFHVGDNPVDDGGPFELGEHAEHLDHHAAGGARLAV